MKSPGFPVVSITFLAAMTLSGARPPAVNVPSADVILAEESSNRAAQFVLRMDYEQARNIYRSTLPTIDFSAFHHYLYGRALFHLGLWEEAEKQFIRASADTELHLSAVNALRRIRALSRRDPSEELAGARWLPLEVTFGQNQGVGDVKLLDDGTVVTAHTAEGEVRFWSASGRVAFRVSDLGRPVRIRPDGRTVWVADMSSGRLARIDPEVRTVQVIELAKIPLPGVRDIAVDPDGTLWVLDYGNRMLVRLSKDGRPIARIPVPKGLEPEAVAVPNERFLLVAGAGEVPVRLVTKTGYLVRGYEITGVSKVTGIAVWKEGIVVQADNGLLYFATSLEDDFSGPLGGKKKPITTGRLGFQFDRYGNLWWADGQSVNMARRLPTNRPFHIVEVESMNMERIDGTRSAVVMDATVELPDGAPIESLDRRSFRVIRTGKKGEEEEIFPVEVENFSAPEVGRRVIFLREASDVVARHRNGINRILGMILDQAREVDAFALLDMADTFIFRRDFVRSTPLVRKTLAEDVPHVAEIDLRRLPALERAILRLAPFSEARVVIWITSGNGLREETLRRTRRMALANQVRIFVLHVGDNSSRELEKLARQTHGDYYRLYSDRSPTDFVAGLSRSVSGRYRILAAIPTPDPLDRGRWRPVALESYFLDEGRFDRLGYFAF
ncbi:MAG: hypothetical protein D6679_01810 [Candidatus Hydrogenedentota bacterium]|nr:MAG: hypothetical protein D6679_01810 [Candidatus Hydrogenedentota bacterium]